MKTSKIYALTYLNTFFSDNSSMHIIVTDAMGIIKYASKEFVDSYSIKKADVLEKNLNDIVEGANIKARAAEIEKTKRFVLINNEPRGDLEKTEEGIYYYPIFDDNGALAYIIVVMEKRSDRKILAEKQEIPEIFKTKKSYADRFKFWKYGKNR